MSDRWPTVDLDPITQLRAVHASLPGTALEERVLKVPFDRLWPLVDDIETFVPSIDPIVRKMEVTYRDGEHVECKSDLFKLVGQLRPGFMWMQTKRGSGRFFVVGSAAVPIDATHTRFAHMEGMRFAPARILRPWFRRTVRWDLNGIERLVNSLR